MGSLRHIREGRVRLPAIRESDFELNSAWRTPSSASGSGSAEEPNENELAGHHKDYINPDKTYKTAGAVAFIYTTDGRVYYGDQNTTHYEIIGRHEELLISRYRLYSYYQDQGLPIGTPGMSEGLVREGADSDLDGAMAKPESAVSSSQDPNKKRCGYCYNYIPKDATVCPDCDGDPNYVDPYGSSYESSASSEPSSGGPRRINSDGDEMEPRDVATGMGDLLGRIGRNKSLVSFWNTERGDYEQHLRPCLDKLIGDGQLSPGASISTPLHGTVPMAELAGAEMKEMTAADHEQMELYKRLHLMRGQEKHDAMKKLGVGGGGVPHAMQAALRGAGLQGPGQKWWAPHSEDFNRRLGAVLRDL